mmetsp:Transcript_55708/g.118496  ORF Transcript_55708/g.118496 Transcript_55708/m.118496 type:complete len:240 (+) Transcript_55708:605-1324(+)
MGTRITRRTTTRRTGAGASLTKDDEEEDDFNIIFHTIQPHTPRCLLTSFFLSSSKLMPADSSTSRTTHHPIHATRASQLGFFDPLGLLNDADQERFDRLRLVELKHGRISMLAVVGYLTTASGYRFPNFPADVPAGFKAWGALASTDDGKTILAQMMAFFAVAEIVNRDADWLDNEAEFVGDFRNGALDFGWDKFDDATKMKKRAIELNNGRAAQMGILGLMVHEQLGVSILPENVSGL